MRKNFKILGAAAVAGLVAVTGSAFTAGGTLPAATGVKSYASQTVTGVVAKSIAYNANAIGDTYTSVTLVLATNTVAKTIQIAFNDESPATCSGTGAHVTATDETTYTCTVNQAVNTATKFALVAN